MTEDDIKTGMLIHYQYRNKIQEDDYGIIVITNKQDDNIGVFWTSDNEVFTYDFKTVGYCLMDKTWEVIGD